MRLAHSHTPSASKIPNNSQHECEKKRSFIFLFVHTIVDESYAKSFPVLSSIRRRLCRVVCVVSGKPMACRVESLSSYAMGIRQWLFSSRKQPARRTYTEWMWTWQNKVFFSPPSLPFPTISMLLACLFAVVFVFCRTWISCHDIKEREESVRPHWYVCSFFRDTTSMWRWVGKMKCLFIICQTKLEISLSVAVVVSRVWVEMDCRRRRRCLRCS